MNHLHWYGLAALAIGSFASGATAVALALFPQRGTGKRRASRGPQPVAPPAPAVVLPDDDTVRIPRAPLVKLLDPDTADTLQIALPIR